MDLSLTHMDILRTTVNDECEKREGDSIEASRDDVKEKKAGEKPVTLMDILLQDVREEVAKTARTAEEEAQKKEHVQQPKKTKGKRKIEMKLMTDSTRRKTTFNKRKGGLFQKEKFEKRRGRKRRSKDQEREDHDEEQISEGCSDDEDVDIVTP